MADSDLPKPVEARASLLLADGSRVRAGERGTLLRVLRVRDTDRPRAGVVEWEDGRRTILASTDVREVR